MTKIYDNFFNYYIGKMINFDNQDSIGKIIKWKAFIVFFENCNDIKIKIYK